MNKLFLIVFISVLLIIFLENDIENFYQESDKNLFNDMLEKHYQHMFPNNANRNSAGFRFFEYIYDNLASTEELFDRYNKFYCAVSGSIVSPENPNNFDVLKVKNLDNKCVYGKYYRCCTPCNCDIMKYSRVVNTSIEMPVGSEKYINRNLLTIGDPCNSNGNFPEEIDKNIFRCTNDLLDYGYRVDNNKLTKDKGRLVIGVLYPLDNEAQKDLVNKSLEGCLSGTKRLLSSPDDLKYGMGDIFVKIAMMNDSDSYTHTEQDLCKV